MVFTLTVFLCSDLNEVPMLVRAAESGNMADALSGGPLGSSGAGSPSDFGMSDDADSPGGQVRAESDAHPWCSPWPC